MEKRKGVWIRSEDEKGYKTLLLITHYVFAHKMLGSSIKLSQNAIKCFSF